MSSLLAVALLVAAGLPLSYSLTRTIPLALVFAPVAGAAVATAAILLMLAAGGPLLAWFAPVYLLTGFLAWRLRRAGPAPHGSWLDGALLTVPLLPPLLQIFQQPLLWDAHLIWWLHAGYFAEGGSFARDSVGNPALIFSHPDYPPLASAPVALAWRVLDLRDFYPAAMVNGALTLSSIAAVVYAVRRVTSAAPAVWSWLAAIAVGWSAWSPLWIVPTAGFSDAMCATAFAAGAVLLLFDREPFDRRRLPLTLLLLCCAALMKNEGQSMVVVLAVVATLRHRRQLRRVAWVWLPVAVAALWSLVARLLGAQTDVLAGGHFGDLLHGDPTIAGRIPTVFSTMAGRVDRVVVLALAAAVLGAVLLRRRRAAFGLGADPWLWAVTAGYWLAVALIYVVTPNDLHWHLSTSVDRVMVAVVVLSCASTACWAVVALSPGHLLGASREAVHPDAGVQ
ncbi:hypothetical protein [Dactylosporangium sp. CA-233914]|uniref:hypothetical protein n=1 Tax=Dactylosporangium sp. CA-233914 TaxID=3239934 RepID=UPI003D8C2CF6